MNAAEAKAIASEAQRQLGIEPLIEQVLERVKSAAEKGKFEVHNPLANVVLDGRQGFISETLSNLVYARLQQDGYKVEHHPDPDPGHPGSGAYTTLSWE